MNRRKKEILKALGEPDKKTQVQGKEVWKYNQMVKDKEQIWDQNIMFDFGRVNYIWSDQPKVKEKKITAFSLAAEERFYLCPYESCNRTPCSCRDD